MFTVQVGDAPIAVKHSHCVGIVDIIWLGSGFIYRANLQMALAPVVHADHKDIVKDDILHFDLQERTSRNICKQLIFVSHCAKCR